MPYLIDGHNLIPWVPGLSLEAVDDEMMLIEQLRSFCLRKNKRAEVYFDNAPPGASGQRVYGPVTAVFARQGSSADAAIQRRLARLGRAARNWTVVSSDHVVQAAARNVRAEVLSAEKFARQLAPSEAQDLPVERPSAPQSPEEIDEWLQFFRRGNEES